MAQIVLSNWIIVFQPLVATLCYLHSVSKETHHEFLCFPSDPGSRSSDLGQVIFDHRNLKQVAKNPVQKCQMVPLISKGMSCFGIRKTAQIPLQSMEIWYFLQTMHFFWP